jgi:hypothetical protein
MASDVQPSLGACPICDQRLQVSEYACGSCGVTIRGRFERCDLCALPADLLHFVRLFLHVEGNLREIERRLGLSYPTVKARLKAVNAALDAAGAEADAAAAPDRDRLRLLRCLRDGELSLEEVIRRLHAEDTSAEGGNDGSDHA